jgi:uncharacterized protein (DUF983 family)
MRVECPHCGQVGKLADTDAGKAVRCPSCEKRFTVDDEPSNEAGKASPIRLILICAAGLVIVIVAAFLSYGLFATSKQMDADRRDGMRSYEDRSK